MTLRNMVNSGCLLMIGALGLGCRFFTYLTRKLNLDFLISGFMTIRHRYSTCLSHTTNDDRTEQCKKMHAWSQTKLFETKNADTPSSLTLNMSSKIGVSCCRVGEVFNIRREVVSCKSKNNTPAGKLLKPV